MPKMVHFGELLKPRSLRSNSVTRQVNFSRTKNGENAKIEKFKCDILSEFFSKSVKNPLEFESSSFLYGMYSRPVVDCSTFETDIGVS